VTPPNNLWIVCTKQITHHIPGPTTP
jgi:hypothetical protein